MQNVQSCLHSKCLDDIHMILLNLFILFYFQSEMKCHSPSARPNESERCALNCAQYDGNVYDHKAAKA